MPMLKNGLNLRADLISDTLGCVIAMSCRVHAAWACYIHLKICAVCLRTDWNMKDM